MLERWQRELKRLRRAEPRADLWKRVEEGPHGSRAPVSGRQRLLAGGVAFAVFIAAALFAWNAFRPAAQSGVGAGTGDPFVIRLEFPVQPPSTSEIHLPNATFSYRGYTQEVVAQGADGWPLPPNTAFTLPLIEFGQPVIAGTPIQIEGDAESVTGTMAPNGVPGQPLVLDFTAGAFVPSEPGRWVLEVTGTWPEGSVSYTRELNVVASLPQATLAFDEQDPQAPLLSLTVGGVTFPTTLGTHSWTFDGGSGSADAVMPTFTDADAVQVMRGTPLFVDNAPSTLSMNAYQGMTPNWGPPVGSPLQLDLTVPGWNFDLPPGRYLVVVDAKWSDAQAEFWLPIEVVSSSSPSETPQPATEPRRAGTVVFYPSGWTPASEILTPNLTDPREFFALGTYPLKPGGSNCAQYPENAIEDLGPTDALIWLAERQQVSRDTPPRPADLQAWMSAAPVDDSPGCLSGPKDFVHHTAEFTDGGRGFALYVAYGASASPETVAEMWRIVDSFQVEPGS